MSDRIEIVTPRTFRGLSNVDSNAFSNDCDLAQGPLSPPRSLASSTPSEQVLAALSLLKDHRKGILDASWTELDLSPDDYDKLCSVLANKNLSQRLRG